MRNDTKRALITGLFLVLGASASVGYADNDRHDRRGGKWAFEPSVDRQETVVVSLSSDPNEDAEPACVALQIAMNLLMDDLNGTEPGGKVDPADSVTLFVTLDGVELVAPESDFSTTSCLTPDGPRPLSGLLSKFVTQLGGEVVVCPLCWSDRGYRGRLPTYGIVASAFDIHDLFLYADKVLTF